MNFFQVGKFPKIGKLYTCNEEVPRLHKITPNKTTELEQLRLTKEKVVLFLGFFSSKEENIEVPPTFLLYENNTFPAFLFDEQIYFWGSGIFVNGEIYFKEIKY